MAFHIGYKNELFPFFLLLKFIAIKYSRNVRNWAMKCSPQPTFFLNIYMPTQQMNPFDRADIAI